MSSIHPSTFSIVAHDAQAGEWGVAVASRFLAVGAVVPFARAGIGAVATQSFANTTYGPAGLELMAQGYSAQEALDGLIAADGGRASRQAGLVDVQGRSATYTGPECFPWAGGRTGPGYAAQGNILTGPGVVDRMAESFESSSGPLSDRLVAALSAGQEAGGDSRGQQSAALQVVKAHGGYGGFNDRYVDLRVEDHPAPIDELRRLLGLYRLYFMETSPDDVLRIDESMARRLQRILAVSGSPVPETGQYDDATRRALQALCGKENLEDRWREGDEIDRVVLEFLENMYGK